MKVRPTLPAYLIPALACILLAGLLRYWIAPLASRLTETYSATWAYIAEDRFRESPVAEWSLTTVDARLGTQTLSLTEEVAIIQQDLYWYSDSGELIFQSNGLYGVDRRTRQNMKGYGDMDRSGQFMPPTHLDKTGFTFWDAMFIGPRRAEFVASEVLDGLTVYKFHFTGTDMDETTGYANLALVPEQYLVHTDGEGDLWIEPLTGTLVKFRESGISYFVDPASGKNVADFHTWSDTFTPDTRLAQTRLARDGRLRSLALELILPIALALTGLAWLLAGWFRRLQK
jgi:hypothetical protein